METNDRVKTLANEIHSTFASAYAIDESVSHEWLKNVIKKEFTTHEQAVLSSLYAKLVEGLEIKITSKPELDFVNPHIKTWEQGYNHAIEDTLTIINSIFKE